MFHEGGQTRKHCFLAMFSEGGQTRKRCFLAMYPEGGQTRKNCPFFGEFTNFAWIEYWIFLSGNWWAKLPSTYIERIIKVFSIVRQKSSVLIIPVQTYGMTLYHQFSDFSRMCKVYIGATNWSTGQCGGTLRLFQKRFLKTWCNLCVAVLA